MAAKVHVVGLGELDGRVAAIDESVDARTQLAVLHLAVAADPRLLEGSTIEIRDGSAENDPVIARAGPFLREGDPVRPVPHAR